MLKNRFTVLAKQVDLELTSVPYLFKVCCILHNMMDDEIVNKNVYVGQSFKLDASLNADVRRETMVNWCTNNELNMY